MLICQNPSWLFLVCFFQTCSRDAIGLGKYRGRLSRLHNCSPHHKQQQQQPQQQQQQCQQPQPQQTSKQKGYGDLTEVSR